MGWGKQAILKINASISYLAQVQLTVDGTEVGQPWCIVRDNKQFVCLKPLLERIFCMSGGTSIQPRRSVHQSSQSQDV